VITIRKSEERGHANRGWLDAHHTFSFASYYDPAHMNFRALRVLNDDFISPGKGFGPHAHRDMEIITYVLDGALEHKDSLGNGSTIAVGEVQRMSAGRGIQHSEFNHSQSEAVHFLQIWIVPAQSGIAAGYEQKPIDMSKSRGTLMAIGTPKAKEGAVRIHQDATLYAATLAHGTAVEATLAQGRFGWLQVARGNVAVNGVSLAQGDGAAISDESTLKIVGESDAEILLFDLA
jgi:redox-sensitive bicupin YhaK (pirin superfamily)